MKFPFQIGLTLILVHSISFQAFAASSNFVQGLNEYKAHHYQSAALLFKHAVKDDPNNPMDLLYLGHSYLGQGYRAEAREVYRNLDQKFPNSSEAKMALQCISNLDASSEFNRKKETKPEPEHKPVLTTSSQSQTAFENRYSVVRPRDNHPSVTRATVTTIRSAIQKLPLNIYKILDEGNAWYYIAPNVVDISPNGADNVDSKTGITRGEEGGRTVDRTIYIYERIKSRDSDDLSEPRGNQELLHITYHEIGHALDACMGNYSKNVDLKAAFESDLKLVSPVTKARLSYYTTPVEGCAEIVCGLLGGDNGLTNDVIKSFPQTKQWLQHKLMF
jgi:tetratricopeptide (TPR) repeat protein